MREFKMFNDATERYNVMTHHLELKTAGDSCRVHQHTHTLYRLLARTLILSDISSADVNC